MILFVFCACFYILRLTSLSLWKTVLTSLSPNQGELFRDSFWDGGVKITPRPLSPPPVINLLELCRKREIFYESTHIDLVQRIYLLLPRPPWFCWCQNFFAKHFFFLLHSSNQKNSWWKWSKIWPFMSIDLELFRPLKHQCWAISRANSCKSTGMGTQKNVPKNKK